MLSHSKRTKLQTLVAVLDQCHAALANVPGDSAEAFIANWKDIRSSCVNGMLGVRPSEWAAGLEQGLREMPMRFQAVEPSQRSMFAGTLNAAVHAEFPDFLLLQEQRLSKILGRGRIKSESDFMLVRHAINVAEV